MAAIDPLKGLNLSLPEIQAAQDPTKALSPDLPALVNNIDYNNPAPIVTPYIPKGTPDGAVEINDKLVGNEQVGPAPGFKNVQREGTLDLAKGIGSYLSQADTWARDKYKYGRTYSYGAGWKNANFERYYSHPNFDKLGFSPYRNNELTYNENSSWWDDFNRMRHQWLGLWWNGVKSAGVGSLFGGADDSAEQMDKAMAIGSSSKGGAGSFITNQFLNGAYTIGILSEIAAENLVLTAVEGGALAAEVPSGGTSSAVLAAAAAKQASNFTKLKDALFGASKISRFLNDLKEVPKAKEAYDAFKLGDKAMDFAKWYNPLKGTTEFATHLAKGTSSFKELGNLSKTVWGFGRFYRDLREIQTVHSEAQMEGASASHKYHEQLIDEYYNKNGKMPEGKDADQIFQRSQSIRAAVTLANDFVIYTSNKIAFEKLFKGFPSIGKTVKVIEEGGTGKTFIKAATKDVLEKGAVEVAEDTFGRKAFKTLTTSPYLPWSKAYMTGNIAEALQENAQDIIQDYQKARHDKIYKDPSQAGFWSAINDLGAATGKQWSGQGLETFLGGYLMGALAGGFQGAVHGGFQKVRALTSKSYAERIQDAKTRAENYENGIANSVNTLAKTPISFGQHNSDHMATVRNLANEMDESAKRGDQYSYNHQKDELEFEHLKNLARTNRMDLYTDHIDGMLNLDDKDLTAAYNVKLEDAKQLRQRLQTRKERAQEFTREYEAVTKEFENPDDPSMFNPETDPERYNRVKDRYDSWNTAVDTLLYSTTASKRIAERMTNTFSELTGETPWLNVHKGGKSIANAGAAAVTLTLDTEQALAEQKALKEEIDALKEGSPADKKQAKEKQVTLDKLNKFVETRDKFNSRVRTLERMKTREAEKKEGLEEEDTLENVIKDFKGAFDDYLTHVAKQQGGNILTKHLDAAFDKVKDYYLLEKDQQKVVSAINVLSNPTYFSKYAALEENAARIRRENQAEDIKEAFKKLESLKKDNTFLNKLFDLGVWIRPEDVEKFKTKPRDVTFYDLPNGKFVAPEELKKLSTTDEKYKKLLEYITEYEKEKGIAPPEQVATTTETTPAPEEKKVEPVAKPKEVIKGEPITPNTSIDVISKLNILRDRLIAAYREENKKRKQNKEPELQNANGTPEEILKTDDFKKFLASGTAVKLINKYNEDTNRVEKKTTETKKTTVKKEEKDPYAKGNSIVFTGTTIKGEKLNKVAGQVLENKGPVESPNGDIIAHPITIVRFDNNKAVTINLEAEDADTYVVEPYEEPSAKIPLTIISQVRQQLYDLGYSKADVDKMKPAQAQDIVTKQTTKPKEEEGPIYTSAVEAFANAKEGDIFRLTTTNESTKGHHGGTKSNLQSGMSYVVKQGDYFVEKDDLNKPETGGIETRKRKYEPETLDKNNRELAIRKVGTLEEAKPEEVKVEEGPSIKEKLDAIEEKLAYLYQDKEAAEIAAEAGEESFEMQVYKKMPKINPESAEKETGFKTGKNKDIDKKYIRGNGVSVKQAAEDIWNDLDENIQNQYSDGDIRNIIIDILKSSSKEFTEKYSNKGKLAEINRKIRDLEAEKKDLLKGETEKVEEPETEEVEVPEFIAKEFPKVKTIEELKELLNAKFAESGLSPEQMEDLEKKLIKKMMTDVSFDTVKTGDILVTPEGIKYTVAKITKNQMVLLELMEGGIITENKKTISRSKFKKTFNMMFTKGLEDVITTPEVTEQEKKESEELIDKINDIDSPEAIINDDEKGAKASASDLDNNLEDLIKSCK